MTTITVGRLPVYVHPDGREEELKIHKAFIEDKNKRKIFVAHRRGRKTSICLEEMFKYLIANPKITGKTYAPIRKQAWEIIWKDPDMLFKIVPPECIKKVDNSALLIELKNGSMFFLDGADDPQTKRGGNVKVLHLTEAGDHKEETWAQIFKPVIDANGGVALFEGNPRGQNWYHQLWLNTANNPLWGRYIATVNDTPIFTKEQLEETRMSVPENVWLAEYMCEWVGSGSTVFRRIIETAILSPSTVKKDRKYRIGIDLAKMQDYTVLSVVDRHTWDQVEMIRFNHLDWGEQKRRMQEVILNYSNKENGNQVEVLIECNGVGDPIYDDLWRWSATVNTTHSIMIRPYQTTNAGKGLLVSNLSMLMSQSQVRLLNDPILRGELEQFTYRKTQLHYIYTAPDGYHDDCVMATMLSYWELMGKFPIPTPQLPDIFTQYQRDESLIEEAYLL